MAAGCHRGSSPEAPRAVAAAPAAPGPFTVSQAGVGAWTDFTLGDAVTEERRLAAGLPKGLTVDFRYPGDRAGIEEGYYGIFDGDTEVAQVWQVEDRLEFRAFDPRWVTPSGVRTTDPIAAVLVALPDLSCVFTHEIRCRSAKEPGVSFVVDTGGYLGPRGEVDVRRIGDRTIVELTR
ncbi:MAG: hypothetical protein ACTHU0_35760 [Kofleriaceae bacterium]